MVITMLTSFTLVFTTTVQNRFGVKVFSKNASHQGEFVLQEIVTLEDLQSRLAEIIAALIPGEELFIMQDDRLVAKMVGQEFVVSSENQVVPWVSSSFMRMMMNIWRISKNTCLETAS